jgi:hypothetical protein
MKMSTVTEKKSSQALQQVEWNLPEGVEKFSEGHVYFAYRTGHAEGADQDEKLFQKLIQDASKQAAKDTVSVIAYMKDGGFTPISAHLKIVSRYEVKVLITVSDSDFIKDSFVDLYAKVIEIQQKSKTDFYSISFTFINRSNSFDEELVRLDGFFASFKPLQKV